MSAVSSLAATSQPTVSVLLWIPSATSISCASATSRKFLSSTAITLRSGAAFSNTTPGARRFRARAGAASRSTPPALLAVSLPEMQAAAQDEGQHLAYTRQMNLIFVAEWDRLAGDANARALAFDAMQNVARGLDLFAARDNARNAVAQRIDTVKILVENNSGISLNGKTLVVAIDPGRGYAGRSSSRAVARALSRLLSVRQVTPGCPQF